MGRDTPPEVDEALGRLNERALDEDLFPHDLRKLTTTELEYLVGQIQEVLPTNRDANDRQRRRNNNGHRARVQLEHRRAIDLQERQQTSALELQNRQLASARRTALIAAVVAGALGIAGVIVGWALGQNDDEAPRPVPVTSTLQPSTTTTTP